MTTLYVTDANTGDLVAVDTTNPTGTLSVIDANTGEIVSVDLSNPTGSVYTVDAESGLLVQLDYANLTGTIHVTDANTGNTVTIDLTNPTGTFYTLDENTGELVLIDLATDVFFKRESLVLPRLGGGDTYHLIFDGVDDEVVIPASASLNNIPSDSFTIEFCGTLLYKPTSFNVIEKGSNETGTIWDIAYFKWIAQNEYYLQLEMYTNDWAEDAAILAPVPLSVAAEYHHYEISFNPNTLTGQIFIDGVAQTTTKTGTPTFTWGDDSGTQLSVGGSYTSSYNMRGNIRYLLIHSGIKHSADFTAPSLTVCPAKTVSTLLRLALDEGSGTSVADTSGNGNNGTISGATWSLDLDYPVVDISLNDYSIVYGQTATATFVFSKEPVGFTLADVTAGSGSLSSLTQSDSTHYTCTFTPAADTNDATNIITVGTGWTDVDGLAPEIAAYSPNYTVDTVRPTATISCTQGVSGSTSSTTPLNYTITFSKSVTGFIIGDFAITTGTKSNFAGSGTTYTCDVAPTGLGLVVTADVAAGVASDSSGNTNTAATQHTITSTAPFTDNFTRTDGDLANGWEYTSGKWTVASSKAVGTPGLGSELLTNGGLEGTYDNEVGTCYIAPNWTQVVGSNTLLGTENVGKEETIVHTGSASQRWLVDSTNKYLMHEVATFNPADQHTWHQVSAWFYGSTGGRNGQAVMGNDHADVQRVVFPVAGQWTQFFTTGRHSTANSRKVVVRSGASTTNYYLDDVSHKKITFVDTLATRDFGNNNVDISLALTVTASCQAGIVMCLDSKTAPANFLLAYHNGTNAILVKCVSGVYTQLISAAAAYADGRVLRLVNTDDIVKLYYNGVQIGTDQNISAETFKNLHRHGMFSTLPYNTLDSFTLSATAVADP